MSWRTVQELRHAARTLRAVATHLRRASNDATMADILVPMLADVHRLRAEVLARMVAEDEALDRPHPYRKGLRGACAWCRGAEDRHEEASHG